MLILIKRFFTFALIACVPMVAIAEDAIAEDAITKNMQLDVNWLLIGMSANGTDLKSSNGIAVNYNYFMKDWLALDAGIFVPGKTFDQSRNDVVGNSRVSIQTQSLMLGLKPRHRFEAPYEVYGRLGLQYWQTELEVEEYFAPGIPGGKVSAKDTGYGYYASLGGAHYVTENVIVQLEVRYMKQLDVFKDKSRFPFDLTIIALNLGVGYRF